MFERTTFDTQIMSGRACLRGMRIAVSVIGFLADMGVDQRIVDWLWSPCRCNSLVRRREYA